MKWYQPIECDKTVKNPLVCDFDNLEQYGYNENNFKEGIYVNSWNENIFFQARKKRNDGKPDDVLQNHLMLPIYSLNLVNALNKNGVEGIQYLPIKIINYNTECINEFFIANILNYIEAFDTEKSDFNCFSQDFPNLNVRGKIAGVKKFVLKKEKIIGVNIIRLKEYKQRFFVSENFKEAFEKNKFTGYSFKEVELV